jgi:hypothetical protein
MTKMSHRHLEPLPTEKTTTAPSGSKVLPGEKVLQKEDKVLQFYSPAFRRNLPQPTICPLCGGNLYDKPYRLNDPDPGIQPVLAFRCRSCEYFFVLQISLNPEILNRDLHIQEKSDPQKYAQGPSYRPPKVA